MIRSAAAFACCLAMMGASAHAQPAPVKPGMAKPDTVTPTTPAVGPDGKKTGVLVPQGSVDPAMNKGAPTTGADRGAVVKPPGTTGGPPGAVAK